MSWSTGSPDGSRSPSDPRLGSRAPAAARAGRGFTLIEVLVAFLILVLSLAALMQVFSGGLRGARVAGVRTVATLLAQSKLAERASGAALAAGEAAGRFDGDYRWVAVIEPYEVQPRREEFAPPLALYRVMVTVSWGAEGEAEAGAVTLATLRLGPPP